MMSRQSRGFDLPIELIFLFMLLSKETKFREIRTFVLLTLISKQNDGNNLTYGLTKGLRARSDEIAKLLILVIDESCAKA